MFIIINQAEKVSVLQESCALARTGSCPARASPIIYFNRASHPSSWFLLYARETFSYNLSTNI